MNFIKETYEALKLLSLEDKIGAAVSLVAVIAFIFIFAKLFLFVIGFVVIIICIFYLINLNDKIQDARHNIKKDDK